MKTMSKLWQEIKSIKKISKDKQSTIQANSWSDALFLCCSIFQNNSLFFITFHSWLVNANPNSEARVLGVRRGQEYLRKTQGRLGELNPSEEMIWKCVEIPLLTTDPTAMTFLLRHVAHFLHHLFGSLIHSKKVVEEIHPKDYCFI